MPSYKNVPLESTHYFNSANFKSLFGKIVKVCILWENNNKVRSSCQGSVALPEGEGAAGEFAHSAFKVFNCPPLVLNSMFLPPLRNRNYPHQFVQFFAKVQKMYFFGDKITLYSDLLMPELPFLMVLFGTN